MSRREFSERGKDQTLDRSFPKLDKVVRDQDPRRKVKDQVPEDPRLEKLLRDLTLVAETALKMVKELRRRLLSQLKRLRKSQLQRLSKNQSKR